MGLMETPASLQETQAGSNSELWEDAAWVPEVLTEQCQVGRR